MKWVVTMATEESSIGLFSPVSWRFSILCVGYQRENQCNSMMGYYHSPLSGTGMMIVLS
jgi:hypothetical protein